MNKPKIKAIVFDLGGVIMSGGYLPFLHHYCLKCLTPEGKKVIEKLEHEANLGTITETQFYKQINKVFGVHLTPVQMHELITKKMRVNKSLVNYIPQLKPARVALFTNSIGHMATEMLKARGVSSKKIFDKTFFSEKVHMAKPDAKAYEYVVKKLGFKPTEVMMVDDRPENIQAARAIGMQGIVFKNTAQFKKAIQRYDFIS